MKNDSKIREDVKAELDWDYRVNAQDIQVTVNNGQAHLMGTVDSYIKKLAAENAALRINGVKGVTNEIVVNIPAELLRHDSEIAEAVKKAIALNSSIDENKIKVSCKDGWVTLEGEVKWEYQRSTALLLTADISGVTGITNRLAVLSATEIRNDIKDKIESALARNAFFTPHEINVKVDGTKVILTGKVRSPAEKSAAEAATWSAPGITEVVNQIDVEYSEIFV